MSSRLSGAGSLLLGFLSTLSFAQWSTNPMENTLIAGTVAEEFAPMAITAPNGFTFITWMHVNYPDGYLVIQLADTNGFFQFGVDGIVVDTLFYTPTVGFGFKEYSLAVDSAGNAIVVANICQNEKIRMRVYKISQEGEHLWDENGIPLSDIHFDCCDETYPNTMVFEDNSLTISWNRRIIISGTNYEEIALQRLSPAGELLWGPGGIRYKPNYTNRTFQKITKAHDHSIFMTFVMFSNNNTSSQYIQRFDSLGQTVWANTVWLFSAGNFASAETHEITSDNQGGCFVTYLCTPYPLNIKNCYFQHVDCDGNLLATVPGIPVRADPTYATSLHASTVVPGSNELVVFFRESSPYAQEWIRGQRFSVSGERLWSDTAKRILQTPDELFPVLFTRTASEGFLVAYSKLTNATTLYCTLLDQNGTFLWSEIEIPITNAPGLKVDFSLSRFHSNQWIAVWTTNFGDDVFGQNIKTDGSLGPTWPLVDPRIEKKVTDDREIITLYPNPFSEQVVAEITLQTDSDVTITVLDALGNPVKTLIGGKLSCNLSRLVWDGTTETGYKVNPGAYFVKVVSDPGKTFVKKVLKL